MLLNSPEVISATVIFQISLMLDVTPCQVFSIFSIMPPKRFVIPSVSISTAFAPGISPLDTISITLPTSSAEKPIASASISHAGTPASVSCRISSAASLPLARICPNARVILSIPSAPELTAAAVSPTALNVGKTSFAAKP